MKSFPFDFLEYCEEDEKLQRKETNNNQTAVSEITTNDISSSNGKGKSFHTKRKKLFRTKFWL